MHSLTSILLITELSELALPVVQRAAILATENRARLTILTVGTGNPRSLTCEARFVEQRTRRMLERLEREVPAGHELRWVAQAGRIDAIERVLRTAEEADLVVMGSGKGCSLRSLLFGTTADRVLRLLRRPVLVVKRPPSMPHSPYRCALVPVDMTATTPEAVGWSARIAPDAVLHLLHVVPAQLASRLRAADGSSEVEPANELRSQAKCLHQLWSYAAALPSHRAFATVAEGHPVAFALKKSRDVAADLIVIGKSGRSVLGDFLLGSTAQRLLLEADVDLLVVPKSSTTGSRVMSSPGLMSASLATDEA